MKTKMECKKNSTARTWFEILKGSFRKLVFFLKNKNWDSHRFCMTLDCVPIKLADSCLRLFWKWSLVCKLLSVFLWHPAWHSLPLLKMLSWMSNNKQLHKNRLAMIHIGTNLPPVVCYCSGLHISWFLYFLNWKVDQCFRVQSWASIWASVSRSE